MANKNTDFDFDAFAVKFIQHIDSIRSILTFGDVNEIKEGANAKPKESRINALYRAIGLPAVIPDEDDEGEDSNSKITKENSLGKLKATNKYNCENIHDINFDNYKDDLEARQVSFQTEPKDNEIEELLDSNKNSILGSIDGGGNKRTRGQLFPMVVDGRIRVHPHTKRIAGSFMSNTERKSKIDGKSLYQQSLIETILYIRLKGENIVNSVDQDETSSAFPTESIQPLVKYNMESLEETNKEILNRIDKTLNCVGEHYRDCIKKVRDARSHTGTEIVPKQGQVAQANPKTRLETSKYKTLDLQVLRQQYREDIKNSILKIFEYDQIETRNILGGSFAGDMIDVFAPKPKKKSASKKDKKEAKSRLEKKKKQLKEGYRSIELLLGTFAGISGVDILVIIAALFKIKTDHLIGLLNSEGKERLKTAKGSDVVSGAKSVTESISALETKVKEIFDSKIAKATKVKKHSNDPQNEPVT